MALLYNDQSVLENHHIALAFQLTLQNTNNINIFAKLTREEFTALRQATVEMVLATDMSRHFEYLTKFQQVVSNLKVLFIKNCNGGFKFKLITLSKILRSYLKFKHITHFIYFFFFYHN